jgi:hypothetical protein
MTGGYRLDLERERSVGEIVRTTLRAYRRYPALFAVLALAVVGPFELSVLAITGYGPLHQPRGDSGTSWVLLLLRTSLVTPLISALHLHAVSLIGEAQRPRLTVVASRGARVLPVVAAASIVSGGGVFLGLLAFVIPGVLLLLRWAVVAQAAALEHEGWIPALKSSARLTHGHYLHVLGLILLTAALSVGVLRAVAEVPLGSTTHPSSVIVGIAVDTLLASFNALTLALLYFDLRARPETSRRAEYQHLRDLD